MQCIEVALEKHDAPPGDVSLLLTNDDEMRRLNLRFRSVDSATDVLTFQAPPTAMGHLGDIAISLEFAARHATLRGVSLEDETAMLAIHGALHLVGFNDETDTERQQMVLLMNDVAKECDVATDANWNSLPHEETDGN